MGEYIDKQATIADLNAIYDKMAGFLPQFYSGYQFAVNHIRTCPAADVEPVRHGRWIDCDDCYGSYVRCSVCEDEFTNWEADCAVTNFCPNCGARMDGRC